MTRRQRLDAELVRRGLAETRAAAERAIAMGRVLVNGAVAEKAARQVHPGDAVIIQGDPPRFVSRGGEKLDAALDGFGVDALGVRALDAGASTGGFTDCLLQRGAHHVLAVDVGHGQLHPRIRHDARVTVLERFHVRDLTLETVGAPVDLLTADLSFISLTRVISALVGVVRDGGTLVLLVKPQFEAGRQEVSKGHGVVTDPDVHLRVQAEVGEAVVAAGCIIRGWMQSPITGGDGNREFLVCATVDRSGFAA